MYFVIFLDRPTATTTRLEVCNRQFATYSDARRWADALPDSRHARVVREESPADDMKRAETPVPLLAPVRDEWGVRLSPDVRGYCDGYADAARTTLTPAPELPALPGEGGLAAEWGLYAACYRTGWHAQRSGLPHRYDPDFGQGGG